MYLNNTTNKVLTDEQERVLKHLIHQYMPKRKTKNLMKRVEFGYEMVLKEFKAIYGFEPRFKKDEEK